ncbi:MAG: agmatine deiminase family protein [Pseudomonadota bacterium]
MKRRQFLTRSLASICATTLGWNMVQASSFKGFQMPDEAEPHERTFMQWPVNQTVYPHANFLTALQQTISVLANTIAEFEPVVMLMGNEHVTAARKKLGRRVEIWDIPTDDLWCRDAGPIFVRNNKNELAVAHIKFNGWGGKQVHTNDGRVAEQVAKRLGVPLIDAGLVGEAGGVETDGDGTLLAHESSWVNDNRNKLSRKQIEQRLLVALGADKMIWAPGIAGADITDYHIDALARFAKPGTVVIQLSEQLDYNDPWSVAAFETFNLLGTATDAKGRKIQLVNLPEPQTTRVKSNDFVASYVNYYVCNGAVISAQFGDRKSDAKAKTILQKLYPGRRVIQLNVDPIGEVGGGIHCATQQQPRV